LDVLSNWAKLRGLIEFIPGHFGALAARNGAWLYDVSQPFDRIASISDSQSIYE
jgi:hypothetical protein